MVSEVRAGIDNLLARPPIRSPDRRDGNVPVSSHRLRVAGEISPRRARAALRLTPSARVVQSAKMPLVRILEELAHVMQRCSENHRPPTSGDSHAFESPVLGPRIE
jgi:hypothetical protein